MQFLFQTLILNFYLQKTVIQFMHTYHEKLFFFTLPWHALQSGPDAQYRKNHLIELKKVLHFLYQLCHLQCNELIELHFVFCSSIGQKR